MKRIVTNLGVLQIFFSLLLVIAIMFVSTYLIYRNSISGIYDKVTQNNTLVFKSVVQSFDDSFRTVDNVIHSVHSLPPSDNLISADDDSLDMTKVYTLVKNLSTLISTVDYIEEVVVFYDDARLAITSQGTSGFERFFDGKYRHDTYNASYWKTYASTKHAFKIFPADTFKVLDVNQQPRTQNLMIAFGGNKLATSNKNVMVMIDVAALLKHVNQQSVIPGASLILLDQDRNIIYSSDKQWGLVDVLNDVYFNADREASLTRENYEYNFYKSDYNGFIYIDKVPYQFQNLNPVTQANDSIMLTAIVCAVALSVFLSIYLNRPVKRILRLLGGGHSKGNDFRKIYSGIVKLQADNEMYREQLAYADKELRRGVFLQALDESAHAKAHDIQLQTYYPALFGEHCFVMVLFQARPREDTGEAPLPVETIADRLEAGLRREGAEASVFHVSRAEFIAVVGLAKPEERARLIKRLRGSIAAAEKEALLGYDLWACVSEAYASEIKNANRGYRDVMNGMLYRNVGDAASVLDVEEIEYVWNVYFPFEKLEKLSNYLLNGKLQESVQIIRETMGENAARNVHRHQLVHIAKSMLFYMLRYAGSSANIREELYAIETEFCRRAEHTFDYRELEEALVAIAGRLSVHGRAEPKNKLNSAFISQYIELHYMENLYLDQIAAVMETTPKYFSNYFKKTFGVNYVEYLNKVRLSHARDLLRSTTLSIAEIGEKTGYLNSSTFTTTFKKYMGVSPSDYRKQNDQQIV
ncbi:Helix-turn-helix domain-containing protein [Cohnella sp. OV330]|uniref:helix-turn-helix domain-containing protein n=1 Tax=Cohnella sp. OV330 TaxID=1855288 RepID=UPI0008E4E13D|nr:helix-turn-helix domain-containing protein [Cohnella sp. OV330]SFB49935.1 Helix-turn-helix domain-containing protein [Cohnella sp. OV330]